MFILRGMQLLGLTAPQLLEDGLFIVRRRRWMKSKRKKKKGKNGKYLLTYHYQSNSCLKSFIYVVLPRCKEWSRVIDFPSLQV